MDVFVVIKEQKKPLCFPFRWEHRGFSRFSKAILTKKRDSLSTVSLVREGGLEPPRPE